MAYARSDMEGMWSSQHVLKVVPDRSKILPGYLYAYLSSKFGVPMITSGTYGAIIQHIEPHHIAQLPVPRLHINAENEIHNLVDKAATYRSRSSDVLNLAVESLAEEAGIPQLPEVTSPIPFCITQVCVSDIKRRFDAFYHSDYRLKPIKHYEEHSVPTISLDSIASSIVEPPRLKRPKVDESEHGIPFFGTSALMQVDPEMSYYISKNHASTSEFIVNQMSVLVPRSGQISGIIGSAVLPYGQLIGGAVSEDAIRINCSTLEDAGFVFVALNSSYGLRQLKARAYGSSIPHLDVYQIGKVVVPELNLKKRKEIGEQGLEVSQLRGQAIELELKAKTILEQSIEEAV